MRQIKLKYKNYRGDTIVEVVISMAILAFALGGAYVLGNKSLSTAVDSNQRKEATAIAQGQIELLRNAYVNKYKTMGQAAFDATYESATDYCISTTGTVVANPTTNATCKDFDNNSTGYSVVIHYDNGAISLTPSNNITVAWPNIFGRGPTVNGQAAQSQIKMYYRLPN